MQTAFTSLPFRLAAGVLLLAACSQDAKPAPMAKAKANANAAPASAPAVSTAAAAQEAPKPAPAPSGATTPAATPATTPAATPAPATAATTEESMPDREKLLDPKSLNEKAPDTFKAKFETNEGSFVIEVTRAWAPNGADRFYNLVRNGFYDDVRFFRVVDGFMAQFGIHGDPKVSAAWRGAAIKDDPVTQSNTRGMVTFAMAGPNTRTTQLFINFVDRNSFLDSKGFPPFGKVVEGLETVDKLYKVYGEAPSQKQTEIQMQGNAFLSAKFPELDYIVKATIVP